MQAPTLQHFLESIEWRLVRAKRLNLLLIAGSGIRDEICRESFDHLHQPVHVVDDGWLTDRGPTHGTVLACSINTLDADHQRAMLAWLTRVSPHVQIISVSDEPIYPLVSSGRFLSELYYRLNTLYARLDR